MRLHKHNVQEQSRSQKRVVTQNQNSQAAVKDQNETILPLPMSSFIKEGNTHRSCIRVVMVIQEGGPAIWFQNLKSELLENFQKDNFTLLMLGAKIGALSNETNSKKKFNVNLVRHRGQLHELMWNKYY